MSMNNNAVVIIGKIFDPNEISEDVLGNLLDERYEDIYFQCGEGQEDCCIGKILLKFDEYADNNKVLLHDWRDFEEMTSDVYFNIKYVLKLPVEEEEIKLYFRDNWG